MKTILETLLEYGVDVKKQGQIHRGFCPFHNDEGKPNFTVYEVTDSWFCFAGCGGGDVIQFVAKIENISRADAKLKLENVKVDICELRDKLENIEVDSRELVYNDQLNIAASKIFHQALKDSTDSQYILGKMREFDKQLEHPVYFTDMVATLQNLKQTIGVCDDQKG